MYYIFLIYYASSGLQLWQKLASLFFLITNTKLWISWRAYELFNTSNTLLKAKM